jgi:hypothetical protein
MGATGLNRNGKQMPIWLTRGQIVRLLRQLEIKAVEEKNYQEVEDCADLVREIYRQARAAGYGRGSLECNVNLPLEGGGIGGGE